MNKGNPNIPFLNLKLVLIALWLILIIGLGFRTLITGDSRFGWGMFKEQVDYTIRYEWLMGDGTIVVYHAGKELKGRARNYLRHRKHRQSRYGLATLKLWVRAYVDTPKSIRPIAKGAIGFQARLHYQVNKVGEKRTEIFKTYY